MPTSTRLLGLSLIAIMVQFGLPAASAEEPLPEGRLKVISYNVQFLPGPAAIANKRPLPSYRAESIGQKMTDYDIVGLNELFDDRPKELLLAEVQKAWGDKASILVSPKVEANRFSGGLAILSHLPFLETNVHTYTQFSSPEKYGFTADGFATKGVLHARVALTSKRSAEQSVDVFVTHLEARERPFDPASTSSSLSSSTSTVRLAAAILLGDFNTRGGSDEMADQNRPTT